VQFGGGRLGGGGMIDTIRFETSTLIIYAIYGLIEKIRCFSLSIFFIQISPLIT